MKALVFLEPRKLGWVDKPEPVAGPGEVIVETRAVAICGSDIHGYTGENRRRTPGNPMGHEATGQVVALGEGVPASWLGKRVVMFPTLACGQCDQCLTGHSQRCRHRRFMGNNAVGAMAERLSLPLANLVPLSDGVSYPVGALTEPTAVAIHGVRQAGDLTGRTVLIAGAGPIGLLVLLAARAQGARAVAVTVRSPWRRELAVALGASVAVDPTQEGWRQEIARVLDVEEMDVAIDAGGIQPTFDQCLEAVVPGGTVVTLGSFMTLQLNLIRMAGKEIHLVGSLTYTTNEFWETAEAISAGKLDPSPLITELRPLSEGAAVFQELADHPSRALRVVLTAGS